MPRVIISLAVVFLILAVNSSAMATRAAMLKFTDKVSSKNDAEKIMRYAGSQNYIRNENLQNLIYSNSNAEVLSDLILEKLFASGKFRLKETEPLDISEERKLYERDAAEKDNAELAMQTGNLDVLFFGEGFSKDKARNIDNAVKGQTIQPEIIRNIGDRWGVDYLIQGSVEDIGFAAKRDNTLGNIAQVAGTFIPAGYIFLGAGTEKIFLNVVISLRIIETGSGKVVWSRNIVGQSHVTSMKSFAVTIGNDELTEKTFHKALDEAAGNIVQTMVDDETLRKFF